MKKLLLLITLFFSILTIGQQGDGGKPRGINDFLKSGQEIPVYSFEQPDIESLRVVDKINDSLKIGPWRFGFNYSTSINFENSASWYTHSNGDKVGVLKVTSDQAKTINLSFSNTKIPEGNELYVYNSDKSFVLGKFTQNHIYEGELGTELVPGNTVFVEYYVPAENINLNGNVEISSVTHGYRTAEEFQVKAFGSSGSCNMNVNCPDGAPYINQRNSAVMLVVGSNGLCSGALINNTQFDGKPYVLTANHCKVNNSSGNWVFRFNWQSDNCNNPVSSPPFQSLSGSVVRSSRVPSDFMLLEITGGLSNGTVPQSHSPFFAGWDRQNAAPQSSFSIHHPRGDIKKISFDDQPPVAVKAMQSQEENSSWMVVWDRNTTTEGGSSGAPLFNQDGQIIGQLWGGNAGCSNTQFGQDYFGRLHNSWEPAGSTNDKQLKHWLDPVNTGAIKIVGYDPYNIPLNNDVSVINILGHEVQLCETAYNPTVEVFNKGTNTITSLTIQYSYNNKATQSINWIGILPLYSFTAIQLPLIYQEDGVNTIEVIVLNPNGNEDQDMSDNQLDISYEAAPNGETLDFEFYLGCYSDEVSWVLKDNNGTTLYSGSGYPPASNSNYLVSETFCLNIGCYELVLKDSHGDGVEGAIYNECDYTGSMILTQRANNKIIASLSEANANFGSEKTYNFCITPASITTEDLENKLIIYPNPSDGNFTVDVDLEGDKNIVLKSVTGRTVASYQLKGNLLKISEKHLSAGIYMVTISNAKRSITRKIIIE